MMDTSQTHCNPRANMDPSKSKPSESQDEGLSNDIQALLQSLPKERGWRTTHLYLYKGVWYTPRLLQAILAFQQHFQGRDTDILLVTTPKSGTTWLKSLVFSIVNRTSSHNPLLTTSPHILIPFVENLYGDYAHIPDLAGLPSRRLFSTHASYATLPNSVKSSQCRILYLCRDPKDVLISLWHFTNLTKYQCVNELSLDEAFELFCKGATAFGPLWSLSMEYWKESLENPGKVLFLRFDEMKQDISSHLKRMAEFLGYPFSLEEEREGMIEEIGRMCSFEQLSNLEVSKTGRSVGMVENKSFFRRGQVGDWANHLTPSMVERFDQVIEQKLRGSGLTF